MKKPVSVKEPAEHEIAPQIERFVSARRHFITAIASKNNVRRVKIFVKKEGFGLVNMILAVVKPFIS
ncbi:hypothetical protein [Neorhizobium vignae]|uniref:hypothetical protein n=1 Tax=Neorhizobium vignae TaxID=690585 RepID=UPI0005699127|nr:hypothetical protein [Neorhizobium vignae]